MLMCFAVILPSGVEETCNSVYNIHVSTIYIYQFWSKTSCLYWMLGMQKHPVFPFLPSLSQANFYHYHNNIFASINGQYLTTAAWSSYCNNHTYINLLRDCSPGVAEYKYMRLINKRMFIDEGKILFLIWQNPHLLCLLVSNLALRETKGGRSSPHYCTLCCLNSS